MAAETTHGFHPVLPRMKKQSRVGVFQTAGQWDTRGSTELEYLSSGLDVERVEFEVNSIPDMWARPILFSMALFDPNHALHARVQGEWRGLLALLALRELRSTRLTAQRVIIPDSTQKGDAADDDPAGDEPAAPNFLEALSKLTPQKTLATDTTWHDLYVLLLNNKPVGITSPSSLVCTATDCYGRLDKAQWCSDGRFLTDPSAQLSFSERQALAGWLKTLSDSLQQHETLHITSKEWDALQKLLENYIEDLGGDSESVPELSELGSLQINSGFFLYLDRPVKSHTDFEPMRSHVRLLPSRQPAPADSILVIDRAIADQWRMAPHDILIAGTISLDSLPFSELAGSQGPFAGVTADNLRFWEQKDFFTERLFVISQEKALPGALKANIPGSDILRYNHSQLVTPILPLTKDLIDYLSVDDLARSLSFEQTSDGILVRLRLRLSGASGTGKAFEIRKEYRFKDREVILVESVPVLEVWPNFEFVNNANSWGAYFTYYDVSGVRNAFYAEPYTPNSASAITQAANDQRGELERYVIRTNSYPEVMACKAPVANPDTNQMDLQPAGLILLEKPQPLQGVGHVFKVGIDFGTTSTNVYLKSPLAEPQPVTFKDHFLQVTASGDRRAVMHKQFLPVGDEKTPFLSLFRDLQFIVNPQQLRPLLDGHIYYIEGYKTFDAIDKNVNTNLKWADDNGARVRVQAFLEQLCIQVAAEAAVSGASSISWAYSYPTAFSGDRQREGFPEIWNQVTRACASATGLLQADGGPTSKTESVASALFFREYPTIKASIAAGTVCIDIGGSTSDIAIWQQSDLCWQTSMRFAGRDMFLNYLREKPELLETFGLDVSKLREAKGARDAFYAQADALLLEKSDELFELLPRHVGSDAVRQLIDYLAVGLSGLFYYVGSLMNFLVSKEKYRKEMPNIYVGGNGARMFQWLAVGNYSADSPINALFKSALLRASGFDEAEVFTVQISPRPKAEAAYGLVSEKELKHANGTDEVVAGESFVEGGKEQAWNELLKAERLTKGLEVPTTLTRLNHFVDTYNSYANSRGARVSPLVIDAISMRTIKSRLATTLSDLKGLDPKNAQVEPVFIMALRHLLELRITS